MPPITLRELKKKTLIYLWLLRPTFVGWYHLYLWLLRPTFVGLFANWQYRYFWDGLGLIWCHFCGNFLMFTFGKYLGWKILPNFCNWRGQQMLGSALQGLCILPFSRLAKNTKTAISLLQIKIFEQIFFQIDQHNSRKRMKENCQYRVLPGLLQ